MPHAQATWTPPVASPVAPARPVEGHAPLAAAAATLGAVDGDGLAILVPIGVAKIVEATSETCYGLAQRHDRMRFVALSRVARGALGLAALLAVVGRGGTLAAGAWALAAAWS